MKKTICLLLCLTVMFSCSGKDKKVLHIYSSLDAKESAYYIKDFEQKTGIDVKWVRLSAGETLARVMAEKTNPQASVWFAGPSPEFIVATHQGLLEPYQPKLEFKMSDEYRDKSWNWVGFYFGAIGFASNSDFLKKNGIESPKSWDDLLNPVFKGHISMAYPYTSGTSYTVISTLLQKFGEEKGWELIRRLNSQIHHYNKSGSAAVTQVGIGEIGVGISFSHDILKKGKGAGYPVELSFPTEGTGHEIGGMALIKGGPEPELGKLFIDYFLSLEAQNMLKDFYRVPLHPQAKITPEMVSASEIKLIKFDTQKAADEQSTVLKKWRAVTAR